MAANVGRRLFMFVVNMTSGTCSASRLCASQLSFLCSLVVACPPDSQFLAVQLYRINDEPRLQKYTYRTQSATRHVGK